MPSRLKGIETVIAKIAENAKVKSSHVPSRLKGIETFLQMNPQKHIVGSSHVPSRLKGIATLPDPSGRTLLLLEFTRAFPFEGN